MHRILFIVALLAVALAWWRERVEHAALSAEVSALESRTAPAAALHAEQQRLRAQLPSAAEKARLLAASAAASQPGARRPDPAAPRLSAPLSAAPTGEWSAPASWQNRGMAAPRDTLETALWAAAGGDVAQFAPLLELSPELRRKSDALLASLPAADQQRFPNAETLIAAFTISKIPIGPAQVVWAQQTDPDHAMLGVFVQNPNVAPEPAVIIPAEEHDDNEPPPLTREAAVALAMKRAAERKKHDATPPRFSNKDRTALAYLSLHRTSDGWRLVVPATAVTAIQEDLSSALPSAVPTAP